MTNNVSWNRYVALTKAMRVLTDKDKRSEYDTARAKYLFNLAQGIEEEEDQSSKDNEKGASSKDGEENVYWTTWRTQLFIYGWFSFLVFMPFFFAAPLYMVMFLVDLVEGPETEQKLSKSD